MKQVTESPNCYFCSNGRHTAVCKQLQLDHARQLNAYAMLKQKHAWLLHEIANQLTILSFDLEELNQIASADLIASANTSLENMKDLIKESWLAWPRD